MKKKTFTPTQAQLDAAQLVLEAKAKVDRIKPIVIGYQTKILVENQWLIDEEGSFEIITDPSLSYLLKDEDFQIYLKLNREHAAANQLTVSNPEFCPLLEAEENLRVLQRAFIDSMISFNEIDHRQACSLSIEKYQQFIDLNLRLVSLAKKAA